MKLKKRLDTLLVEKGIASSRQKAQALIMAGEVLVDGQPVTKPGSAVSPVAEVTAKTAPHPFVSRGGVKLAGALEHYRLDVTGKACLDVGASTGGFTDCLLQNGARCVYAVDVGYGQLAWQLRQDPRVHVFERTNIRRMPPELLPERVALATIDVSFISLKLVVPAVMKCLRPEADILALIKPQFEVGRNQVGKGGVVRDRALHRQVIESLSGRFSRLGLQAAPPVPSPIRGPKGNIEFFILLNCRSKSSPPEIWG
jgi:23S rRNA (cytidine1920-2'-O)/16S rRNA (cytidine1409-2'-O)-methyltransferase